MDISCSPFRYPGGKQVLARALGAIIRLNGCEGGVYAEPYAGGCGAGLNLLFSERVSGLMINDADWRIYAFWQAILTKTDAFLELLRDTPITVSEWRRQRETYERAPRRSMLRAGFATFYLNRCNRSGIISNGGPIGGTHQRGKWRIDARFNRVGLRSRIERIAFYRDRIWTSHLDAIEFLEKQVRKRSLSERVFAYLDPPYFAKGRQLYMDYYEPADHATLASYLKSPLKFPWALTYDNAGAIRRLYDGNRRFMFNLAYSARERRVGKELFIVDPRLRVPADWGFSIPGRYIGIA
jgi:DNA adenine methylase